MVALQGLSFIGFARGRPTGAGFRAVNPAAGVEIEPVFHPAADDEVDRACELAAGAAPGFAALTNEARAAFLEAVAVRIEALAPQLVARAGEETGLPAARLQGEIGRTTGQLRLFAGVAGRGDWVDPRIERADPDRKPAAKPDHRSLLRPLGPVAVFCASNFPFAFSVAGGDTAAALSAGCPVVVMAHHAHVGTAELVGGAVVEAVKACGLPEGTFSLVMGAGRVAGQRIARHPAIRAIGFTGSRAGGRALMDIAAAREAPIPVYAEMSSVNPVVLLEGALASRGDALAAGLFGSCTLGVGQFCTQPGVVILVKSVAAHTFVSALAALFADAPAGVMLTSGIHRAYEQGVAARKARPGVTLLAGGKPADGPNRGVPALLAADAATFLADHSLHEEIFGPTSLVVWCDDDATVERVARSLPGNLTATVHGTDAELAWHAGLLAELAARAGRVVANGYPTGVEVSHAIVHGGPWPALSDGRSTSVGSAAILRFARPVCYQNFPDAALPAALRNANPLGLARLVDGVRTTAPVA
jgi:NADP-dependent aldehyde dehydrogenase